MTAPRQLLGWTVPDHFTITTGTGGIHHVTCRHLSHEGGWPGWVVRESQPNAAEKLAIFLRHNAHGETVEPLEGVLPETPEPVSMPLLPTYETYFHGEKLVQCGGCGKQVLQVLHSCKGIPAPQSSPAPLLPLSAPVETEGGEGGGTEALSPDLIEPLAREMAIQGNGFTEQSWSEAGKYSRAKWLHLAELAAAAFLGAGWTPPQHAERQHWMVSLDRQANALYCHVGPSRSVAETKQAPFGVNTDIDADGQVIGFEVLNYRPDEPLPAHEVEWSVRAPDASRFYYRPTTDEEDAREEAACREGNTLGKRDVWYGPWVAVPVEPKETK